MVIFLIVLLGFCTNPSAFVLCLKPLLITFANSISEGLNQGFNYGMTLVFENPEARDAYLPHPEHERVKSLVIPLLKDGLNSVIAVDWYLQGNDEF